MKQLLIAGCGDLGQRLARRLDDSLWTTHGLRRNPGQLENPVRAIGGDLLDPASLEVVAGQWDAIIYQATPGQRSPEDYRRSYVDGLVNLLQQASADRLIFVSSSAVYGQDQGQWVDETSPTEPDSFAGQILLEAEAAARRHNGIVVRFSGIYGPGRDYLIRSLSSGQARCRPDPPQWTNRIHAEDCAGVLSHVLELEAPEPVYCASDPNPTPRCEVLQWLADQLGVPGPGSDRQDRGQGKRVSSRRLTDSGFKFQYPDYQTGYGELLP
ncbi:MAG: SDR family oxidoreductase [Wenzhouxiangella sp.]|nr:MAG: SDR family oxidoreductase [Wenzhouxiangella sp.]